MDGLDPDAELAEFRSILRRLLERHTSGAATGSGAADWAPSPQTPAGGYDPQLWKLLTHQVGVAGLAVPERFGGSGGGYRECHLVLEELGRAGVASPFLASSVLATQALLLTGGEAIEILPALAAGTLTATVIWGADSTLTATADATADEQWVLDGRARYVLDGARADLLLAVAETHPPAQTHPPTDTSPGLFLLDVTHPGLRRVLSPTMDQSLPLAEVHARAVPARRLGDFETSTTSRLADLAATAITAEQVGGARRCLELTVEYAKTRVQFDRPIGSFQAIKHRLADLLVLVESAQSASQAAAQAWADDADDASLLASLAKSYCSEAFRTVAGETIQLHGGIGFTWEHQAHRYFKRAHSTSELFGNPSYHRRRIAASITS